MFISARTERIAVTRSTTQPISASAAGSLKSPASSARITDGISASLGPASHDRGHLLGGHAPALRGHSRQHQQAVALGRHRPQLFGDEGHERVQQFQDLVARPGDHGAGLGLRRALLAHQHGLCEFDIPVAIDVPDEAIDRIGRVVEAIALDRLGDLARRPRGLMRDPAVQRLLRLRRIEIGRHARSRSSRRSGRRSTAWSQNCGWFRPVAATA